MALIVAFAGPAHADDVDSGRVMTQSLSAAGFGVGAGLVGGLVGYVAVSRATSDGAVIVPVLGAGLAAVIAMPIGIVVSDERDATGSYGAALGGSLLGLTAFGIGGFAFSYNVLPGAHLAVGGTIAAIGWIGGGMGGYYLSRHELAPRVTPVVQVGERSTFVGVSGGF